MDGNPILLTDPRGDKTDDRFYDENGELLYDDGIGNDEYIIPTLHFYLISYFEKDNIQKTKALKNVGLKVYESELNAVVDWSTQNNPLTHKDKNERAVQVFSKEIISETGIKKNAYILGQTVLGQDVTKQSAVIKAVDPKKSIAKLGGNDLRLFGWLRTAMAHTHPPGTGKDEFSIDYSYGELSNPANGGDIPVSLQEKTKLYLAAPTGVLKLFDPETFNHLKYNSGRYHSDKEAVKQATSDVFNNLPKAQ
jgi:hypothetical protein